MSYISQYKMSKEEDNPIDSVSQIVHNKYAHSTQGFIAASWDGFLRYYEIDGSISNKYFYKKWEYFFQHPILSCDILPNMLAIVGLANGQILLINIANDREILRLGCHQAPICKVFWCREHDIVISLGYDHLLKFFNFQLENNSYQKGEFKLPSKISSAALDFPFLLVCSSDNKAAIIEMENLQTIQIPQSFYDIGVGQFSKFSCCSICAIEKKLVFGTVDGLLCLTHFEFSQYSGVKINKAVTIKTQKKNQYSRSNGIGQVNAVDLGIKDKKHIFCICAGSIETGLFDAIKDKKLKNLTSDITVTAMKISPDGELIVYAGGNDWSKGLDELYESKRTKILGIKISTSDVVSNYR